jgi:hypothetical protein
VKTINLTRGLYAIVDDEDFDWASKFKWHAAKTGYATRRGVRINGNQPCISLHREIVGAVDGDVVDHINGNRQDNRRCNLRITTYNGNAQNRAKRAGLSSKYKGVHLARGKWQVTIKVNNKPRFLGLFDNEIEAAMHYDVAALTNFGVFAKTNFCRGLYGVNL